MFSHNRSTSFGQFRTRRFLILCNGSMEEPEDHILAAWAKSQDMPILILCSGSMEEPADRILVLYCTCDNKNQDQKVHLSFSELARRPSN